MEFRLSEFKRRSLKGISKVLADLGDQGLDLKQRGLDIGKEIGEIRDILDKIKAKINSL